jgi:RNA polymerase sigma factor (sigma-70 family)
MSKVDDDEPVIVAVDEPAEPAVLLRRFIKKRDEAAFAALVEHFGPLVLNLCRRMLHHEQDAEDAFQATFLVLARKAKSIDRHASVGSWLYRVAFRIARDIQTKKARLPVQAPESLEPAAADTTADLVWRDLRPILDAEVNRLPPKYREPFVLCNLQGMSNEEAADELDLPLGTVASRLSRAREWLRKRLSRRGLSLSVGALAMILFSRGRATAAPPELMRSASRAALRFANGDPPGNGVNERNCRGYAETYLRRLRRQQRMMVVGVLLTSSSILGVIALAILAVLSAVKPREIPDQEHIQGVWAANSTRLEGTDLPSVGSTMTFRGDRWSLHCEVFGPGAPFDLTAKFELRPSSALKEIDFIDPAGRRLVGIYQFDGDTLRLCYNARGAVRPTSFASPPGSTFHLYEFHRQAPPAGR